MGPTVVVVFDPCPEGDPCVLDGLEVSSPGKLLFEGLDEALTESVLLRRVRRDVFLGKTVVADDRPIAARAKDESVVVPDQHTLRCVAQRAETGEQGVFQCPFGRLGFAGEFQGMAEGLTGAAVDNRDEDTL